MLKMSSRCSRLRRREHVLLDQLEALVELIEHRKEVVDELVEHLVEQERVLREARRIALEALRGAPSSAGDSSRRTVTRKRSEKKQCTSTSAVLVGRPAVEDQEDEVLEVLRLRPLPEMLGVLDRKRMEAEGLAQERRRPRRSEPTRSSQKNSPVAKLLGHDVPQARAPAAATAVGATRYALTASGASGRARAARGRARP